MKILQKNIKMSIKVIRDEAKRDDLPIMYNMNFGHTAPMFIYPMVLKQKQIVTIKSLELMNQEQQKNEIEQVYQE